MPPHNELTARPNNGYQHAHSRQDWTSAKFVEEGIRIQIVYGTQYAAGFLKTRMIEIDVALRVLLNPGQRRYN